MNDYVIYTDSACDIPPEELKELGIPYDSLLTYFEGEGRSYTVEELSPASFYEKMREGHYPKTSAVNVDTFAQGFERILSQDLDILYIGLSSGVSSTYASACTAAKELLKKYPKRKILTVDSCSGSVGQAVLVKMVAEEKKRGATIEEAATFAEAQKEEICLWATFDDLTALQKSGRVRLSTALIGNLLHIKPTIYVDERGVIVNHSKVRGRKKSIGALLERYEKAAKAKNGKVYLAHSACREDVDFLAQELKTRYQATVDCIMDVGPVIGAHSGIGALVLSFIGNKAKV